MAKKRKKGKRFIADEIEALAGPSHRVKVKRPHLAEELMENAQHAVAYNITHHLRARHQRAVTGYDRYSPNLH